MVSNITPFLWFEEDAVGAAEYYASIFPNSRVTSRGFVVSFQLLGQSFLALGGHGRPFKFTPNISLVVCCDTVAEVDTYWSRLIEGGVALKELQQTPFSEKYGCLTDKHGLSWQILVAPCATLKIAPSVTFTAGQARDAMKFIAAVMPNSKITCEMLFGPGECGLEGLVKHGEVLLNGNFVLMTSETSGPVELTGAVSLMVTCKTQEEIDRLWAALGEGGCEQDCGWVTDRFGVTWQIVPECLPLLMATENKERNIRVSTAMCTMKKFVIADLQKAYDTE